MFAQHILQQVLRQQIEDVAEVWGVDVDQGNIDFHADGTIKSKFKVCDSEDRSDLTITSGIGGQPGDSLVIKLCQGDEVLKEIRIPCNEIDVLTFGPYTWDA